MIIISPVITEKSMNDVSKGRYTFRVDNKANKNEIKKEVEKRFTVNVTNISTVTIKGRTARRGSRRNEVKLQPFKKAVVTLKAGQKIGMFESGGEK